MNTESLALLVIAIIVVIIIIFIKNSKGRKTNHTNNKANKTLLTKEEEQFYHQYMNTNQINILRNELDILGEDEEEDFKRFIFRDGGIVYLSKLIGIRDFEVTFGDKLKDHSGVRVAVDFTNEWKLYRENNYKKPKESLKYINYKGDYSKSFWEEMNEKIKNI